MYEPSLFDMNHSLDCRREGHEASTVFAKSQRQRIYEAILFGGELTALEIVDDTGIRLSSVNGRLNELLADGKVRKSGKKKNLLSGIQNTTWSLA
jgi:predicted transcriptional regulator